MKKRMYAGLLALVLMFSVTACGKPAENPNPEQGTQGTENVDSSEKNETPENTDVLGGIYPEGDKLEELVMGTRVNGEQVEFCKVKVPSNFWIGAGYLNEEGYDNSFEMADGDDEVGEAISEGLLTGNDKIYTFFVNNGAFASPTTTLTCGVYSSDQYSYEEIKAGAKDYKVIGSGETEAFYHEDQSESPIADLVMSYKLGDKGMLQIGYIGPVSDEIGLDQLAQNIYDLITVIE